MLTNYIHAVLAVVLAQFTGLGFLDGMEGVIRLAEASPWIKVTPTPPLFCCFLPLSHSHSSLSALLHTWSKTIDRSALPMVSVCIILGV